MSPPDDRLPRIGARVFRGCGGLMMLAAIPLAFGEPGALALIPFGLVFVGAGWLVRRVFVTPPGKQRVVVESHQVAIETSQGAVGTRAQGTTILVDADAGPAEVAAARKAWEEAEWAKRPDWVAGRIEEEGLRRAGNFACGGLVWTVVAVAVAVFAAFSGEQVAWGVAGVMGLLGLGFFGLELIERARRRKYGQSLFILARTPVHPGERLQGVVQTGVRADAPLPPDGFAWRLECVHRWEEQTRTDDGRLSQQRRDVLWEANGTAEARPSPAAPGFLAFPLALDLPADRPAATLGSSRDGIAWTLSVRAALPGLDYQVEFALPVL